MRPLVANPKRDSEAATFHRRVFKAHGSECHWCSKKATDAAHVVPRSQLGKQRYACAEDNGRPACRGCHDRNEASDPEYQFSLKVRRRAVKSLNVALKVKIAEPAR
jgi:hypothetical protein